MASTSAIDAQEQCSAVRMPSMPDLCLKRCFELGHGHELDVLHLLRRKAQLVHRPVVPKQVDVLTRTYGTPLMCWKAETGRGYSQGIVAACF